MIESVLVDFSIHYTIVIPPNKYTPFYEIALPLYHCMLDKGYSVDICIETPNFADNIFYILYAPDVYNVFPKNCVLYQLEQLEARFESIPNVVKDFIKRIKKQNIWEFSHRNIEFLNTFGCKKVIYMPLRYHNVITFPRFFNDRKTPILFYGILTERRVELMKQMSDTLKGNISLCTSGLNTETNKFEGMWNNYHISNGELKFDRARLLTNTIIGLCLYSHTLERSTFDIARILFFMANEVLVISERTNNVEEKEFEPYIVFVDSLDEIEEKCKYYLLNAKERVAKVESALKFIKTLTY